MQWVNNTAQAPVLSLTKSYGTFTRQRRTKKTKRFSAYVVKTIPVHMDPRKRLKMLKLPMSLNVT